MKDAKVCIKGAKFPASMRVFCTKKRQPSLARTLHVGWSRTKRLLGGILAPPLHHRVLFCKYIVDTLLLLESIVQIKPLYSIV